MGSNVNFLIISVSRRPGRNANSDDRAEQLTVKLNVPGKNRNFLKTFSLNN